MLFTLVTVGMILLGLVVGSATGPVVGFAFGLTSALLVQSLVAEERKQKTGRVARDMIATEVIFNLREVFAFDKQIQRTAEEKAPMTIRPTGTGLRRTVLERLVTPDVIDALTERESSLMVECLYGLTAVQDAADTFYNCWTGRWTNPSGGDLPVQAAYDIWRNTRLVATINLLQLLMMVVHSQTRAFGDEKIQAIADATSNQREEWHRVAQGGPHPTKDRVLVVGASADLQLVGGGAWNDRTVVVSWKHNWPDCPIKVVELSKIAFPTEV